MALRTLRLDNLEERQLDVRAADYPKENLSGSLDLEESGSEPEEGPGSHEVIRRDIYMGFFILAPLYQAVVKKHTETKEEIENAWKDPRWDSEKQRAMEEWMMKTEFDEKDRYCGVEVFHPITNILLEERKGTPSARTTFFSLEEKVRQ